jgi:hypothetical protein
MTQPQLERAVADRTGESLRTVHDRGFHLQTRPDDGLEPEDLCLALDCPACGRTLAYPGPVDGEPAVAECDRCDIEFEFDDDEVYVVGATATPVIGAAA